MPGEIDLYGIFVPTLLIQALAAYFVLYLCSPVLDRLQAKRLDYHAESVQSFLYIIILGMMVMISVWWWH